FANAAVSAIVALIVASPGEFAVMRPSMIVATDRLLVPQTVESPAKTGWPWRLRAVARNLTVSPTATTADVGDSTTDATTIGPRPPPLVSTGPHAIVTTRRAAQNRVR